MNHLESLRRKAVRQRAETPAIISSLSELGVTGRAACSACGVSDTVFSLWKSGVNPIPEKHRPVLLDLARQAQRILQESAHVGANRLKLARAEGLLRIAEAEANHDPR